MGVCFAWLRTGGARHGVPRRGYRLRINASALGREHFVFYSDTEVFNNNRTRSVHAPRVAATSVNTPGAAGDPPERWSVSGSAPAGCRSPAKASRRQTTRMRRLPPSHRSTAKVAPQVKTGAVLDNYSGSTQLSVPSTVRKINWESAADTVPSPLQSAAHHCSNVGVTVPSTM